MSGALWAGQTAVVISKQIGHTYFAIVFPFLLNVIYYFCVKFKQLSIYNSKGDELKT